MLGSLACLCCFLAALRGGKSFRRLAQRNSRLIAPPNNVAPFDIYIKENVDDEDKNAVDWYIKIIGIYQRATAV